MRRVHSHLLRLLLPRLDHLRRLEELLALPLVSFEHEHVVEDFSLRFRMRRVRQVVAEAEEMLLRLPSVALQVGLVLERHVVLATATFSLTRQILLDGTICGNVHVREGRDVDGLHVDGLTDRRRDCCRHKECEATNSIANRHVLPAPHRDKGEEAVRIRTPLPSSRVTKSIQKS